MHEVSEIAYRPPGYVVLLGRFSRPPCWYCWGWW